MTGVQIGKYHTFHDWGLYLRSVEILLPQKKEYKISLPAGNGELDFSDALTGGEPKFHNRLINMIFEAVTENDSKMFLKASEIANIIHGRKENIIFDDDRGFYYTGVCSVNFNRKNPMITSFFISVDAEPFKYDTTSSMEEWKWDDFNFFTGVIRTLADITITSTNNKIKIFGAGIKTAPVFVVKETNNLKLIHNGRTYPLKAGRNRFPAVLVGEEDVTLTFTGAGRLSVDYRGRYL